MYSDFGRWTLQIKVLIGFDVVWVKFVSFRTSETPPTSLNCSHRSNVVPIDSFPGLERQLNHQRLVGGLRSGDIVLPA